MSTFLYNNARHLFSTGALNWPTSPIKAMLVSSGYGALRSDIHVSDIPVGEVIIRDLTLTGLGELAGVCYGNIPQINAFLNAAPVVALVLYSFSGVDSTSPLIYYSSDGIGFPFLPQGFNYAVLYDLANGGWFQV